MVFIRPCNVWYVTRAVLSVRSDGGTSVGYNTPAANQANASNADAESLTRGDFLGTIGGIYLYPLVGESLVLNDER